MDAKILDLLLAQELAAEPELQTGVSKWRMDLSQAEAIVLSVQTDRSLGGCAAVGKDLSENSTWKNLIGVKLNAIDFLNDIPKSALKQ